MPDVGFMVRKRVGGVYDTYRRCVNGDRNALGTLGCRWHLCGCGILNSSVIVFTVLPLSVFSGVRTYKKHGIV